MSDTAKTGSFAERLRAKLKERSKGEPTTWGLVAIFMEMIDEVETELASRRFVCSSWSPSELRDVCTNCGQTMLAHVDECAPRPEGATHNPPWEQCEFKVIAWEIDQGKIGISVKAPNGKHAAWLTEPVDHVQNLLLDGLRYRWLRGATTDYSRMCEQALCLEALDEWIDESIARSEPQGQP